MSDQTLSEIMGAYDRFQGANIFNVALDQTCGTLSLRLDRLHNKTVLDSDGQTDDSVSFLFDGVNVINPSSPGQLRDKCGDNI